MIKQVNFKSALATKALRIVVFILLTGLIASTGSCSSAKKGMVPCPCHYKNQRR